MADIHLIDVVAGEIIMKRVPVVIDAQDGLAYALTPEREGLAGKRGVAMHAANVGGTVRVSMVGAVPVVSVGGEEKE